MTSDASRNLTSLAGGADGRIITIMNTGSFPIVLKNDDGATGTPANRFALPGDVNLTPKQNVILMYNSTALRWRQLANSLASGTGDNLGNHIATQNIQLNNNWLSNDGGNEGVAVDNNGNVGIGTPAGPFVSKLYVQGDSVTFRTATDSTGNIELKLLEGEGGLGSGMHLNYGAATNDLRFDAYTNSVFDRTVMTFQRAGNVGIGTINPAAKLDVTDGYIRALDGANNAPGTGLRNIHGVHRWHRLCQCLRFWRRRL